MKYIFISLFLFVSVFAKAQSAINTSVVLSDDTGHCYLGITNWTFDSTLRGLTPIIAFYDSVESNYYFTSNPINISLLPIKITATNLYGARDYNNASTFELYERLKNPTSQKFNGYAYSIKSNFVKFEWAGCHHRKMYVFVSKP